MSFATHSSGGEGICGTAISYYKSANLHALFSALQKSAFKIGVLILLFTNSDH